MRSCTLLFGVLLLIVPFVSAAAQASSTPAIEATYCELASDPAKFNHKVIRIQGLVSHGFEDFQLVDPECLRFGFSIWLTYGGKLQSNTAYCCPGESSQPERTDQLEIEGIPLSISRDAHLETFSSLLRNSQDTTVSATLIGHFFSGKRFDVADSPTPNLPGGLTLTRPTLWRGYGHMGCCSLLVIEKIDSIEAHRRNDLDYSADGGWSDNTGLKCEGNAFYWSTVGWHPQLALRELQIAESGTRPWAYNNPEWVAEETIHQAMPGNQKVVLKSLKRTPSRIVFQWQESKEGVVTVVVTRPYWLSLYATNEKAPWVVTSMKRPFSCD